MNIDIVLFAGRIVLVALLYIFLFAVMKTGVGLVRGQRRDSAIWTIDVDKGGVAVDVAVENSLYGEIRANLNLASRYDVDTFLVQARSAPESLLSRMTGGVHLHTLRCPDRASFERIRAELDRQGLLYRRE